MSKYFYVKSENQIYEPNGMNIGLVTVHNDKYKQIYRGKPEWEDLFSVGDHFYSDYVEFDKFEDLVEIGDLVRINKDLIEVDNYYLELAQTKDDSVSFDEIYKHIGKDFIRVCHKEEGNWVID